MQSNVIKNILGIIVTILLRYFIRVFYSGIFSLSGIVLDSKE